MGFDEHPDGFEDQDEETPSVSDADSHSQFGDDDAGEHHRNGNRVVSRRRTLERSGRQHRSKSGPSRSPQPGPAPRTRNQKRRASSPHANRSSNNKRIKTKTAEAEDDTMSSESDENLLMRDGAASKNDRTPSVSLPILATPSLLLTKPTRSVLHGHQVAPLARQVKASKVFWGTDRCLQKSSRKDVSNLEGDRSHFWRLKLSMKRGSARALRIEMTAYSCSGHSITMHN